MAKRRGYPDRRGMGAQSDFASESFVLSEQHRTEQMVRARALMAAGVPLERAAEMLAMPAAELREELARAAG